MRRHKNGGTDAPAKASPAEFVQIERSFIRDTTLRMEERWTGIVLASFEDRRGIAFPGKRLLRAITGLGFVRLEKALADLAKIKRLGHVQERVSRGRFGGSIQYKTHGILHPRKDSGSGDSPPSPAGNKHEGSNRVHGRDRNGRERPKMRG